MGYVFCHTTTGSLLKPRLLNKSAEKIVIHISFFVTAVIDKRFGKTCYIGAVYTKKSKKKFVKKLSKYLYSDKHKFYCCFLVW